MISMELKQGNQYRIPLSQGDEVPVELTLRTAIGDPIDLTNLDVSLILKHDLFDTAPAHTLAGTLTAASDGIVTFDVTDTETADVRLYVAEIEVTAGAAYTETLFLLQVEVRRGI